MPHGKPAVAELAEYAPGMLATSGYTSGKHTTAPIAFDQVSKTYRLGRQRTSLLEALQSLGGRALPARRAISDEPFWALKDVSFAVEKGRALGIIGSNGAGKTTTLKLLSGITRPTTGSIRINGRVSSLIELGAGFHPDLTGRENIYLNGAILGMRQQHIKSLFDTIVDFAGVEAFLDTPVKRYSSGMYARLGFAVAAHVEPDVLLIDEVLSVGDIAFQAKCAERMKQLRQQGTTIIFISHNMHAVNGLCDSCLLLEHGQVRFLGPTAEAIRQFQQLIHSRPTLSETATRKGTRTNAQPVEITRVDLVDEQGRQRTVYELGETVIARIHYHTHDATDNAVFSVGLMRADGLHVCSNTSADQLELRRVHGVGVVELRIPRLPLIPAVYSVVTSVSDRESLRQYVEERLASFEVRSSARFIDHAYGVFVPDFQWRELEGSFDQVEQSSCPA